MSPVDIKDTPMPHTGARAWSPYTVVSHQRLRRSAVLPCEATAATAATAWSRRVKVAVEGRSTSTPALKMSGGQQSGAALQMPRV